MISLHRMIYPMLVWIFKSMREHEFVYVNALPDIKENVIYAVNHSCKFDIPYVCELIAYILVGKQPLRAVDRLAFYLNGTVWVDRKSKTDKKKATAKMIVLLKNGADLIMFPEGTWNLTPSRPMLPLYWGIIDIARHTEKPIIPVILEYTDKKCYVSFGNRMDVISTDDKAEKN